MARLADNAAIMTASPRHYAFLAVAAALLLGSCAETTGPSRPTFYDYLDTPGATVDAQTAATMISQYRANHGLRPVTVDPALMAIAEKQVQVLAARDSVQASLEGDRSPMVRLQKAGYAPRAAAENVSAGYLTLAQAFSGWRDSPPHNANMLNPAVTRIGIATAYVPGSKYHVFWDLILAQPGS